MLHKIRQSSHIMDYENYESYNENNHFHQWKTVKYNFIHDNCNEGAQKVTETCEHIAQLSLYNFV